MGLSVLLGVAGALWVAAVTNVQAQWVPFPTQQFGNGWFNFPVVPWSPQLFQPAPLYFMPAFQQQFAYQQVPQFAPQIPPLVLPAQLPVSSAPTQVELSTPVAPTVSVNQNGSCILETDFPSVNVTISGQASEGILTNDKRTICEALRDVPFENADTLKRLTIRYGIQSAGERGKAGGILMFINGALPELRSVFFHELGHNVDSGLLQGSIGSGESVYTGNNDVVYNDDPSIGFYSISWSNAHTMKNSASKDFVSGYAKTDPEEDFAESYNFYVNEGNLFRMWARQNSVLQQKYEWLREHVFDGREYNSGQSSFAGRPWDGTIMK